MHSIQVSYLSSGLTPLKRKVARLLSVPVHHLHMYTNLSNYCFQISVKLDLLFIVFTATFSLVPSGQFNWPSITEPNSPEKRNRSVILHEQRYTWTICKMQIERGSTIHKNTIHSALNQLWTGSNLLQELFRWQAGFLKSSHPEALSGVLHWHPGSWLDEHRLRLRLNIEISRQQ